MTLRSMKSLRLLNRGSEGRNVLPEKDIFFKKEASVLVFPFKRIILDKIKLRKHYF